MIDQSVIGWVKSYAFLVHGDYDGPLLFGCGGKLKCLLTVLKYPPRSVKITGASESGTGW